MSLYTLELACMHLHDDVMNTSIHTSYNIISDINTCIVVLNDCVKYMYSDSSKIWL